MLKKLALTFICLCYSILYAQNMEQYPLSRQDSAIILSNLEKYGRELKKEDWKEASRYLNANGLIYWEHNFLDTAINYYEQSIELNQKVNNASGIAMIYNNLGMIEADLYHHEKALEYFEKTLAARKFQKKKRGMIAALHNIAIELNNLERHNEAIIKLEEALIYAREMNDPEQLRLCYGMLAETYEKNGDSENSLKYFNLYRTFHEMIQKEQLAESAEQVREAEDKLRIAELEQRNKDLELQLRQQTIVRQEKIIEEKETVNTELVNKMTDQQKRIKIIEQEAELMRQETELLKKDSEIKKLQERQLANQAILIKRRSVIQVITILTLIGFAFATYFFFLGRSRERRANVLLTRLNTDIENRNQEIVQQAEKLQAQNMELFRLNRFKDGMTGMLVHDMKNPLNVIFHHIKDIHAKKPQQAVKNAGRQMMNMIQNLLDVQKFQNSKVPLNLETIFLQEFVEEAVENVEFLASRKNLNIIFQSDHAYTVRADKDVISRVLVNLLTNAIKYSPLNKRIVIRANAVNDKVKIEVEDFGPGIEEENQQRVFEMFSQVEPLQSGSMKSSGIGLAFCKLAIQSHGTKIGLKSKPGEGSCFWFTLQLIKKEKALTHETILNGETAFQFSTKELAYLQPFVEELQSHNIFELSQIRNIIRNIEPENAQIEEWKTRVSEALMSVNEEKFKGLLNSVTQNG